MSMLKTLIKNVVIIMATLIFAADIIPDMLEKYFQRRNRPIHVDVLENYGGDLKKQKENAIRLNIPAEFLFQKFIYKEYSYAVSLRYKISTESPFLICNIPSKNPVCAGQLHDLLVGMESGYSWFHGPSRQPQVKSIADLKFHTRLKELEDRADAEPTANLQEDTEPATYGFNASYKLISSNTVTGQKEIISMHTLKSSDGSYKLLYECSDELDVNRRSCSMSFSNSVIPELFVSVDAFKPADLAHAIEIYHLIDESVSAIVVSNRN